MEHNKLIMILRERKIMWLYLEKSDLIVLIEPIEKAVSKTLNNCLYHFNIVQVLCYCCHF